MTLPLALLLAGAPLLHAAPPVPASAGRSPARLSQTTVFDDALTVVMPVRLTPAEDRPVLVGGAPASGVFDLDDAQFQDASLRLLRDVKLGAESWDIGVTADAEFVVKYLVFSRGGRPEAVLSGKFEEMKSEREVRLGGAVYRVSASITALALKLKPAQGPELSFGLSRLHEDALRHTAHLAFESPREGRFRVLYTRIVAPDGTLSADRGLVIVKEVTSDQATALLGKWLKDKVLSLFVKRDKIRLAWPIPLDALAGERPYALELEAGRSLTLTLKGRSLRIDG